MVTTMDGRGRPSVSYKRLLKEYVSRGLNRCYSRDTWRFKTILHPLLVVVEQWRKEGGLQKEGL